MSVTRRKGQCAKTIRLTDEDKRELAGLIKLKPELWDLNHINYKNREARETAWNVVAEATTKTLTVERCKSAWSSLQDALRYQKAGNKLKSGDAPPSPDLEDESHDEMKLLESWKFYECMKFYVESKPVRITLSSLLCQEASTSPSETIGDKEIRDDDATDADPQSIIDNADFTEVSSYSPKLNPVKAGDKRIIKSAYSYSAGMKTRKLDPLERSTTELVDGIKELIALKKPKELPQDQGLKYMSMYLNMDRMLKKLPEDVVEDLNFQFNQQIYEKIKSLENSSA